MVREADHTGCKATIAELRHRLENIEFKRRGEVEPSFAQRAVEDDDKF